MPGTDPGQIDDPAGDLNAAPWSPVARDGGGVRCEPPAFVALLVPSWAGEIGEYAVLGRTHLPTVPGMVPAVLLRPVEDVRRHVDTICVPDRAIR